MAAEKFTFKQFQTEYPNDGACLDKIMEMTYGGTSNLKCPGCGHHTNFHRIEKRRGYACQDCGHHIYPCVGTIFEKSRTPLNKWFYAMYLFTSTRHGVPARELERQLGVTYKCAWRIAHELRKLMATADYQGPMSGHVEIDETLIGGRTKAAADKTGRANKVRVLGIAERDGRMRAGPIPDVTKGTLESAVKANVELGSRISTDEWVGYRDLRLAGYDHQAVNHNVGEYARGDVHTNSVEGYWSRLKNSIKGTHVHISQKHAWKYIGEFSFRYNMRKRPAAMFDRMVLAVSLPRIVDG